jgi:hypothetical protein
VGLIAVGSMAERDYAPDEGSDHDFLVVTPPGGQEELRQDLSWLPHAGRIAMSFRETDHGLKVVYDDGHMLEFAVFDLEELGLAGVNRYRVLIDRGGVEARVAEVAAEGKPQRDDEHLFGMIVTAALVAGGRGRRGEVLSAAFLVTWGMTYLTRLLARHLPSEHASLLDQFDPLRRFERAYPDLGAELAAICRLPPSEGGPALLDVLERELRAVCPELPWGAAAAVRERFTRA